MVLQGLEGPGAKIAMTADITISSRDLTPFECLVMDLLCQGKSNAAIAAETSHTEKVVENTVSRTAKAFGIRADGETNLRVLLALAYRTHYGDKAFDRLGVECQHFEIDESGRNICTRHNE